MVDTRVELDDVGMAPKALKRSELAADLSQQAMALGGRQGIQSKFLKSEALPRPPHPLRGVHVCGGPTANALELLNVGQRNLTMSTRQTSTWR